MSWSEGWQNHGNSRLTVLHVSIHSSCLDFGENWSGSSEEREFRAPAISLLEDYQNETSGIPLRTGRRDVGTWIVALWAVVITTINEETSLLSFQHR